MNTFESKILNVKRLLVLLSEVQKRTLELFGSNRTATLKEDQSPVTEADLRNHEFLTRGLPEIFPAPVWSEEAYPDYESRRRISEYWLVDPLDGTKEFTKGVSEFSVLLSLMRHQRPVFAAILIPAQDRIFLAEAGRGVHAFEGGRVTELTSRSPDRFAIGLLSRSHEEPEVSSFYRRQNLNEILKLGSALKFCALVTDDADMYFRHKGPHEWDVAAGDLIVQESGGLLVTWPEQKLILYNQEATRVPPFIALRRAVKNRIAEVLV